MQNPSTKVDFFYYYYLLKHCKGGKWWTTWTNKATCEDDHDHLNADLILCTLYVPQQNKQPKTQRQLNNKTHREKLFISHFIYFYIEV